MHTTAAASLRQRPRALGRARRPDLVESAGYSLAIGSQGLRQSHGPRRPGRLLGGDPPPGLQLAPIAPARADLFFYRYTDHPPKPLFTDTANPAQNNLITAAAGGADASFWMGDEKGSIYRYERTSGWDSLGQIPDWDPKRATVTHAVNAIAVNAEGRGIAVGEGGRIADIAPGSVTLDPASDRVCSGFSSAPPCTTSLDLTKAAIAPDGSAIAAGKNLALLWRPAGGDFRLIAPPPISATNDITGVALPSPDRAYLAIGSGLIYRGDLSSGHWSWTLESSFAAISAEALTNRRWRQPCSPRRRCLGPRLRGRLRRPDPEARRRRR